MENKKALQPSGRNVSGHGQQLGRDDGKVFSSSADVRDLGKLALKLGVIYPDYYNSY